MRTLLYKVDRDILLNIASFLRFIVTEGFVNY